MDYPEQDWPWTLWFESERLPAPNTFDLIGDMVPVPEPTAVWFFHFTACIGCIGQDQSAMVAHHAAILLQALRDHKAAAIANLPHRLQGVLLADRPDFPPTAPATIVANWIRSLERMCDIATTRPVCHWVAGYESDQRHLPAFSSGRSPGSA